MILFFRTPSKSVIATEIDHKPSQDEINELCWLYVDATLEDAQQLQGFYVGPRREMITPWGQQVSLFLHNEFAMLHYGSIELLLFLPS